MATAEDLFMALEQFVQRFNSNKLVKKMVRDWDRHIFISVTDLELASTVVVQDDAIKELIPGESGKKDVSIIAPADVIVGIFTGKLNPAKEYAKGNVKFIGSPKDEMKVDAIIQYLWS